MKKGLFLKKTIDGESECLTDDMKKLEKFMGEWEKHIGEYWEMFPIEIESELPLEVGTHFKDVTIKINPVCEITGADILYISKEDGVSKFRVIYPITEKQRPIIWMEDGRVTFDGNPPKGATPTKIPADASWKVLGV